MVEDVDLAAQVSELLVADLLNWSSFSAGSFHFDEGVLSVGKDDESVGHSGKSWAGEFEGDSAAFFGGIPELVFDYCFAQC